MFSYRDEKNQQYSDDFWDRKLFSQICTFWWPFLVGSETQTFFFAWIDFLSKNVLPFDPCPQTTTIEVMLKSIAQQSISTWPTYIICPRHRKASLFLIKDSCSPSRGFLLPTNILPRYLEIHNAFTEHCCRLQAIYKHNILLT